LVDRSFGGCGVLVLPVRFLPVGRRLRLDVAVASLMIESIRCLVFFSVRSKA
jgi:hypothetical protein